MSTIRAYYNDIDPNVCSWVRGLIRAGLVMDGDVDERSIKDVQPDDLRGYTRCHFFCGILGWELALQIAQWPTEKPLWSGSPPCQPFSSAGQQKGTQDERHLWPEFSRLIRACRPPVVMGEQVASRQALQWLDGVFDDLEGAGYTCGAADTCAPSVGAYHIRQRLYWLADCNGDDSRAGLQRDMEAAERGKREQHAGNCGGNTCGLAHAQHQPAGRGEQGVEGQPGQRGDRPAIDGNPHRLVNPQQPRLEGYAGHGDDGNQPGRERTDAAGSVAEAGSTNRMAYPDGGVADTEGPGGQPNAGAVYGFQGKAWGIEHLIATGGGEGGAGWASALFIPCRDGKYRPVPASSESEVCGLVDGLPDGVARPCSDRWPLAATTKGRAKALKGLGNAIVPQQAADFIRAYLEAHP